MNTNDPMDPHTIILRFSSNQNLLWFVPYIIFSITVFIYHLIVRTYNYRFDKVTEVLCSTSYIDLVGVIVSYYRLKKTECKT